MRGVERKLSDREMWRQGIKLAGEMRQGEMERDRQGWRAERRSRGTEKDGDKDRGQREKGELGFTEWGCACTGQPYRSRFLSVVTSRFMDSADSVTSSSSRCSLRRPACALDASSSASSSCRFSCFTRRLPFSSLAGARKLSRVSGYHPHPSFLSLSPPLHPILLSSHSGVPLALNTNLVSIPQGLFTCSCSFGLALPLPCTLN